MSGRASPSTTGQQHHSQGCNKSKSFDPSLQQQLAQQRQRKRKDGPSETKKRYNSSYNKKGKGTVKEIHSSN
jgi:hypothetical protein